MSLSAKTLIGRLAKVSKEYCFARSQSTIVRQGVCRTSVSQNSTKQLGRVDSESMVGTVASLEDYIQVLACNNDYEKSIQFK